MKRPLPWREGRSTLPADRIQTNVVCSPWHDPWLNLAAEEYLLGSVCENQIILYLWRNESTVVLGKNQNAWKECDWQTLESEGGKLSRRLSGGGAVYHDLGNLNFTFVMDRRLYNLRSQMRVILTALDGLGIHGEFTGRNDLVFHGGKFSGNAFCFQKQAAYHHGTLLVRTDISKLSRYLTVPEGKIRSKGIDSVESRVVNLSEIRETLSTEELADSIRKSFGTFYGGPMKELTLDKSSRRLESFYRKYASWSWRFGESPNFDIQFQKRFSWGDADLGLKIQNGIIRTAVLYSDAMDSALVQKIARRLKNVPLDGNAVAEVLNRIEWDPQGRNIIRDLLAWLAPRI